MDTFTPRAAGALAGSHDAPSPSLVNFPVLRCQETGRSSCAYGQHFLTVRSEVGVCSGGLLGTYI